MDKEDSKTLQHISDTLDEMLMVLKKPDNVIVKGFEFGAAIVSIAGIIFIIEKIIEWIGG